MQPGTELRFTSETSDGAKQMQEDVLREVFGFANVSRHAKTDAIDVAMMFHVELVESLPLSVRECLSFV
jgi:hypothetical protein